MHGPRPGPTIYLTGSFGSEPPAWINYTLDTQITRPNPDSQCTRAHYSMRLCGRPASPQSPPAPGGKHTCVTRVPPSRRPPVRMKDAHPYGRPTALPLCSYRPPPRPKSKHGSLRGGSEWSRWHSRPSASQRHVRMQWHISQWHVQWLLGSDLLDCERP